MSSRLYRHIYNINTLYAAWRKVRSSALGSSSEKIRNEAKDFEARMPVSLKEIQSALTKKQFLFAPQIGVAPTKPNGSRRPIVLAPIPNRIVQRALLDALHLKVPFIKHVFAVPTSFGGIPDKRVSMAIAAAKKAMKDGAKYYIRSDIPEFFTKIDKAFVLELFAKHVRCPDTFSLFEAALRTDLANLDALRREQIDELFPIGVQGVAQGSPLSPLVANIYLYSFDMKMNREGITCLRYIDDFLLLGPDSGTVQKAFKASMNELKELGLTAYSPHARPDKASQGPSSQGVDFLGCTVTPGLVQPSKKSRSKFRERIRLDLEASMRMMRAGAKQGVINHRGTYSGALQNLDRVILGWGKAFSFCQTDAHWACGIDTYISQELARFERDTKVLLKGLGQVTQRRVLGVRLLVEVNAGHSGDDISSDL
ncbi:maturase [Pseudomonas oryzihabitans]|nr:maturase [Pseudomonas psychrotolerans]